MSEKVDHRKVYSKGYFDGLKAAGIDTKGMDMNLAKYESAHRDLSAIAKRTYAATPDDDPINAAAISAEMRRLGTGGNDSRVTLGCLNTLIEAGLVVESQKGCFKKIEVRKKAVTKDAIVLSVVKKEEPKMAQAAVTVLVVQPIDRLTKLSARLRELANDMDNAAIELAEQAEKNDNDTAKLRQLQSLLKSLG